MIWHRNLKSWCLFVFHLLVFSLLIFVPTGFSQLRVLNDVFEDGTDDLEEVNGDDTEQIRGARYDRFYGATSGSWIGDGFDWSGVGKADLMNARWRR